MSQLRDLLTALSRLNSFFVVKTVGLPNMTLIRILATKDYKLNDVTNSRQLTVQ